MALAIQKASLFELSCNGTWAMYSTSMRLRRSLARLPPALDGGLVINVWFVLADGNKVASQVPVLPRCGVRSVSDVQAYEVTQIEHIATTAGCAAGWLRNGCHSAVGTGGTRVMTPFGPAAPTAWPHGQGTWTWIDCIVDHVSVTVIQSS